CTKMFLILPTNSLKRENQIKNIFKYCLWLPLRAGVKQRQYFKSAIYYTHEWTEKLKYIS
ncbi:MAG TPA: hypothetical protein PKD85_06370, partial [Saprospiraceae bacterium]|nr:hypothetical protein [Saprospiraceae bacterium]